MIEEFGEASVKTSLFGFSCQLNKDVEVFLHEKAIEFSKQYLSKTHLIYTPYKGENVLAGYFTLATKSLIVKRDVLSKTMSKKIVRFSTHDREAKQYVISATLIGQLGKNDANGYGKLISGDDILAVACDQIRFAQAIVGGRFVYLECEDHSKLREFYHRNGFFEFGRRNLDPDETDLQGSYLLQLLRYL